MSLLRPVHAARRVYDEYPRTFWTIAVVTFIDRLGGALIFPFFALYITSKFGVGMTEVGILFMLFSIPSFFGGLIGGALADRFGRKGIIVFSLTATAASTLMMGFIETLEAFYVLGSWWACWPTWEVPPTRRPWPTSSRRISAPAGSG
jgi:MFS family permease